MLLTTYRRALITAFVAASCLALAQQPGDFSGDYITTSVVNENGKKYSVTIQLRVIQTTDAIRIQRKDSEGNVRIYAYKLDGSESSDFLGQCLLKNKVKLKDNQLTIHSVPFCPQPENGMVLIDEKWEMSKDGMYLKHETKFSSKFIPLSHMQNSTTTYLRVSRPVSSPAPN